MPPGAQSSSYHKKLVKCLGFDVLDERLQWIDVPGYRRSDRSRASVRLPLVPPHESLVEEVLDDPDILAKVNDATDDDDWYEDYSSNPSVSTPGLCVLPGALHVDGVPYSNADGVVAFWFYCLVTGRRHSVALVRKRNMCRCGCVPLGWCTINCILTYLSWSLSWLAVGK